MAATNWTEILKQKHARYYADDGWQLVLGEPLPYRGVAQFQNETGYQWSNQFFTLYTHHNGVGMVRPGEKVNWHFVPTSQLPDFVFSVRDWFVKTHPQAAEAFIPFSTGVPETPLATSTCRVSARGPSCRSIMRITNLMRRSLGANS